MSLRTTRQMLTLPGLPSPGPLPPMISVIVPIARTNLITNPSIELATTNYTAVGGSIARSATKQYHGTYSLAITPGAGTTDGAYYGSIALTSGTIYAFSCKVWGIPGIPYKISIASTAPADLSVTTFIGTGRWQWLSGYYLETSSTNRRFYFTKNGSTNVGVFYVDGVQIEAINAGELVSTYIDGDQLGLLVGQQPAPYLWTGTPHASTSTRSILTRAGGYLVNWSFYNFVLTGILGLGMAVPNNVSIPYTVLDGARFVRTTKPPRTLTFTGRFQDDDQFSLMSNRSDLRALLDRDLVPIQQPLVLQVEPQDECGNVIGDFARVQCLYAGGLDGNDTNIYAEDVAPTFTMYLPYLIGGDSGAALSPQQSVANANGIVARSPAGVWSGLGTGISGGTALVNAMTYGLDGTLYIGGSFTDAGGSGADYIAKWSGGAWSVVKSATSLNSAVYALTTGPDGRIYVGGDFTNADGIAAADFIAVYDPVANTWAALGTGAASTTVFALAFDRAGNLYAGGTFTGMGGVATTAGLAKWNGSAWSSIGSAAGGGASVVALVADPATGYVYAAGSFLTLGGVACVRIGRYNGVAWTALSTGLDSTGRALAFSPSGLLYVGGSFVVAGGVTVNYIATWNGTAFSPLGTGMDNLVSQLMFDFAGTLWAGGTFSTAGGVVLPDGGARWNGSAWLPPDIDFPGTPNILAMRAAPDGTVTFAYNTSGSATAAVNVTVTNDTPGIVYPTVVIKGPTSGAAARVYQIVNYTTGFGVWLSLSLNVGETATLIFNPTNPSYTSTFQGDITNTILPGSQPSLMYLAPGVNTVSFFAASSTIVGTVISQKRYNGMADLVN